MNTTENILVQDSRRRMMMEARYRQYIAFKDPVVAELCKKFSSDGKGVTYADAAAVTNATFRGTFVNLPSSIGSAITSFDEFQYFTGITDISGSSNEFSGFHSLKSVILPENLWRLGTQNFRAYKASVNIKTDCTIKILNTQRVISIGAITFGDRNNSEYAFRILVPSSLVDSYKTAGGYWDTFTDNIEGY